MSSGLILADTSAWVEYLRGTGSPENDRMRSLMTTGDLLVTEPVLLEVLAGARDDRDWRRLRRLLGTCDFAKVDAPRDWVDAAALHRRVRLAGRTIASMLDCLVAVVALRVDAAVLHKDADFDAIARQAPLRIA